MPPCYRTASLAPLPGVLPTQVQPQSSRALSLPAIPPSARSSARDRPRQRARPTPAPAHTPPPPPRTRRTPPPPRPTRSPGGCTLTPTSERPLPFPGRSHPPLAAELSSPLISLPDLAQSTQPKILSSALPAPPHIAPALPALYCTAPMSRAPSRTAILCPINTLPVHTTLSNSNIFYTPAPPPLTPPNRPPRPVHTQAVYAYASPAPPQT